MALSSKRRLPPESQDLVDALAQVQSMCQRCGTLDPGGRDKVAVSLQRKRRILRWFASLQVEERVRILSITEPSVVRLLVLLAISHREGSAKGGIHKSTPYFFVFHEGVPSLGGGSHGGSVSTGNGSARSRSSR